MSTYQEQTPVKVCLTAPCRRTTFYTIHRAPRVQWKYHVLQHCAQYTQVPLLTCYNTVHSTHKCYNTVHSTHKCHCSRGYSTFKWGKLEAAFQRAVHITKVPIAVQCTGRQGNKCHICIRPGSVAQGSHWATKDGRLNRWFGCYQIYTYKNI